MPKIPAVAWDCLASKLQNMLYQLPASRVESGSGTLSSSTESLWDCTHTVQLNEDHPF